MEGGGGGAGAGRRAGEKAGAGGRAAELRTFDGLRGLLVTTWPSAFVVTLTVTRLKSLRRKVEYSSPEIPVHHMSVSSNRQSKTSSRSIASFPLPSLTQSSSPARAASSAVMSGMSTVHSFACTFRYSAWLTRPSLSLS